MIMRHAFVILLSLLFVAGCKGRASSSGLVRSFGSSTSPDGSKTLEVTRREKSLVDFEVRNSASGKVLASDRIGSDAMRWFLYWETPTRLWGYGSDAGYFKLFEFNPDGSIDKTTVQSKMAVPPIVWDNLPSLLQKKQKAQQAAP
jgi:hypothetical protein